MAPTLICLQGSLAWTSLAAMVTYSSNRPGWPIRCLPIYVYGKHDPFWRRWLIEMTYISTLIKCETRAMRAQRFSCSILNVLTVGSTSDDGSQWQQFLPRLFCDVSFVVRRAGSGERSVASTWPYLWACPLSFQRYHLKVYDERSEKRQRRRWKKRPRYKLSSRSSDKQETPEKKELDCRAEAKVSMTMTNEFLFSNRIDISLCQRN